MSLIVVFFISLSLCQAPYNSGAYGQPGYGNPVGYVAPPPAFGSLGGYGQGAYGVPAIAAKNVATGTNIVDNSLAQSNLANTNANQNLNYNAAIANTADSTLATCAAFVCVEFDDSTAYGTNTVNTYAGQQAYWDANQGAAAAGNQVQQASYSYPQTFSAYALYGGFPGAAGTAAGAAFPFYGASQNNAQQAYAYGNSAANQATTVHNDYFNQNHAYRATGKKCSKYVCTHSTDQATTNQFGPNYNVNNNFDSSAAQLGPNVANSYLNTNKYVSAVSSPYSPY